MKKNNALLEEIKAALKTNNDKAFTPNRITVLP
jgi:hypothetical protein